MIFFIFCTVFLMNLFFWDMQILTTMLHLPMGFNTVTCSAHRLHVWKMSFHLGWPMNTKFSWQQNRHFSEWAPIIKWHMTTGQNIIRHKCLRSNNLDARMPKLAFSETYIMVKSKENSYACCSLTCLEYCAIYLSDQTSDQVSSTISGYFDFLTIHVQRRLY